MSSYAMDFWFEILHRRPSLTIGSVLQVGELQKIALLLVKCKIIERNFKIK